MTKAVVRDPVLHRLGYTTQTDLILHLPLRYEDETRLTPLHEARPGQTVTLEGVVVHAGVQMRPRRQLVVELTEMQPPSSTLTQSPSRFFFRLLHFYPSQSLS